jgi:hypothetical protein
MGIVVPGASWRELLRGKPLRKEKETEQKKGDISNEVRKGTFLKSFDSFVSSPDGLPAKLARGRMAQGVCTHLCY